MKNRRAFLPKACGRLEPLSKLISNSVQPGILLNLVFRVELWTELTYLE